MKLQLSGSQMDRVDNCIGSVALPVVRQEGNPYAGRGTAIHDFLAHVGRIGKEAAIERVPEEWRPACESIPLASLPQIDPDKYAAEVSILLDVATGRTREIGRGEGRAAYDRVTDREETELGLTIDTLGIAPDAAVVYDYKTGWAPLTPPRRNWQMRSYGLGASIQYEKPDAVVGLIRIPEDAEPWTREARLTPFDLDSVLFELQEIYSKALEQMQRAHDPLSLSLSIGPWCRYCESFAYCPAQRSLIASVASNPEAFVASTIELLTPNHAGDALARLIAAEKALERVREAVKAYAKRNPFATNEGMIYGPVAGKDLVIDAEMCVEHIKKIWNIDASNVAADKKTTKDALKRAARVYKLGTGTRKSLTDLVQEALEGLKASGAIREIPSETIKAHAAGKTG